MNILNKPLDGLLRISRISSNQEDDFVRIEIVDDISGTVVIHADVSLTEFAKTLFGSERLNTKFTLRSSNVGRKAENKTEMVKMPLGSYTEKRADKALAKFEVDGWRARREDLQNHHRWSQKDKGFRVTFFRFVDVEDSK